MSDLQRIFDTDPAQLTREDIDKTIAAYRAKRQDFNLGLKTAKPKEKLKSIDLDELLS